MNHWLGKVAVILGLFMSACLSVAGLVGLIVVIRMGVLSSDNPMGHIEGFEEGWALFYLLLLGLPCLTAMFAGLTPWALWFKRSRKGTETPTDERE